MTTNGMLLADHAAALRRRAAPAEHQSGYAARGHVSDGSRAATGWTASWPGSKRPSASASTRSGSTRWRFAGSRRGGHRAGGVRASTRHGVAVHRVHAAGCGWATGIRSRCCPAPRSALKSNGTTDHSSLSRAGPEPTCRGLRPLRRRRTRGVHQSGDANRFAVSAAVCGSRRRGRCATACSRPWSGMRAPAAQCRHRQQLADLVRQCVGAKKEGHGIDSPEFLRPRRYVRTGRLVPCHSLIWGLGGWGRALARQFFAYGGSLRSTPGTPIFSCDRAPAWTVKSTRRRSSGWMSMGREARPGTA